MSQKKHNVEDFDLFYRIGRYYMDFLFLSVFKKIKFIGKAKIPTDGAVLFTPNHCNGLMDALAVLTINNERKVFISRADIFKNSLFTKVLTFLKIIPINRVRDGIRSVLNSDKTIKKSIEILNKNVKICIFSEGFHRDMHSLLPIGKGVARIAYGANQEMGKEKPMYLVPVGLDYGDYYRLRSTLLVQIGDPINVTDYINCHPNLNEHDIMQGIRQLLKDALSKIIVYIDDDEDYQPTWEIAKLKSGSTCKYNLTQRLADNRDTIAKINALKASDREKADHLFDTANELIAQRNQAKISINSVTKQLSVLGVVLKSLILLIFFPLFAALFFASSPYFGIRALLCSKIKDKAFIDSVSFGGMYFIWSFFYCAWIVVLFCLTPWMWATAILLVLWWAPQLCFDYFEYARICASDWRYLFNRKLKAKYQDFMKKIKNL